MQCDCWRPLRLPGILVGDSRLGGISTTLSAYETLIMRGYDVPAIVMAGGALAASNSEAIQQHARPDTAVFTLNQALPAMQATDRFASQSQLALALCCKPPCCPQHQSETACVK